jgi:hypothetical protein
VRLLEPVAEVDTKDSSGSLFLLRNAPRHRDARYHSSERAGLDLFNA